VAIENQTEEKLDDVGIVQITQHQQQQHDRGSRNGRIKIT
jgi:hypothetical protein